MFPTNSHNGIFIFHSPNFCIFLYSCTHGFFFFVTAVENGAGVLFVQARATTSRNGVDGASVSDRGDARVLREHFKTAAAATQFDKRHVQYRVY